MLFVGRARPSGNRAGGRGRRSRGRRSGRRGEGHRTRYVAGQHDKEQSNQGQLATNFEQTYPNFTHKASAFQATKNNLFS